MTYRTHVAGALAAGFGTIALTSIPRLDLHIDAGYQQLFIFALSIAGGLFPDIDLQTSTIGKNMRHISRLINKLFGHRNLFHAPILYIAIHIALITYFPAYKIYVTAWSVGVASHLLLDMLNPTGIPLFYPISKKYRLAKIRTSGEGENFIYFCLGIANGYLISRSIQVFLQK